MPVCHVVPPPPVFTEERQPELPGATKMEFVAAGEDDERVRMTCHVCGLVHV